MFHYCSRSIFIVPRIKKPPSLFHRPISLFPSPPLLSPSPSSPPKNPLIPPPPFPSLQTHLHLLLPPRHFSTLSTIPTPLQPPLIFSALLLALWAYKCAMLVLFQNRIIYMPSMPPFSRAERIRDYEGLCRPVVWREERIFARDGVGLGVAVGEMGKGGEEGGMGKGEGRTVVIIYFQGNGSSTPPRLPSLSSILKLLHEPFPSPSPPTVYTILALSYRGYWTSTGRASEPGLVLDAEAILAHAALTYPPSPTTRFVLWGQSLGASVALTAAANAANAATIPNPSIPPHPLTLTPPPPIHDLILETPFLSIHKMLLALYPQRWLPYRYLGPFLRNHWDVETALHRLVSASARKAKKLNILILQAARDELVPPHHAVQLERSCLDLGFASLSCSAARMSGTEAEAARAEARTGVGDGDGNQTEMSGPSPNPGFKGEVRRIEIGGAYHTDILSKASGRKAVVEFLRGDSGKEGPEKG